VNSGNPTSTKNTWAPGARAATSALGGGALGLLLYHLTGSWPAAGGALLLGSVLAGLLVAAILARLHQAPCRVQFLVGR